LIRPADYASCFLPHDLTAIEPASEGWFNMLHLCGARIDVGLVDRLPTECVNWSTHDEGNPTLAEVRDRFGRAVAGGLHRRTPIVTGTPDEVQAEAMAALEETGGRGHLLTPGCSVSPWAVAPAANVEALAGAAGVSRPPA
jgi:uroporphyrinogen decarboxylase